MPLVQDDWAPFSLVVRPVSSNSPSLSLPLQGWSTDQFPPQIRLKVYFSLNIFSQIVLLNTLPSSKR